MFEFKEDKDTKYVIDWKSEEVCASKLSPLYTTFFHEETLLIQNRNAIQ